MVDHTIGPGQKSFVTQMLMHDPLAVKNRAVGLLHRKLQCKQAFQGDLWWTTD